MSNRDKLMEIIREYVQVHEDHDPDWGDCAELADAIIAAGPDGSGDR